MKQTLNYSNGITAIRTYQHGNPVPTSVEWFNRKGERVPVGKVLIADNKAHRGPKPTR